MASYQRSTVRCPILLLPLKRGILGVPVLLFGVLCLALPGRATAESFVAYIANTGSSDISVIDTSFSVFNICCTNRVVATVTVGDRPSSLGLFIGPLPANADQPELTEELELTHFGSGGGLQSDVVVFNTSATATATGRVDFFDPDGAPHGGSSPPHRR